MGALIRKFSPGFVQLTVELSFRESDGLSSVWHRSVMVKLRVKGTREGPAASVGKKRGGHLKTGLDQIHLTHSPMLSPTTHVL